MSARPGIAEAEAGESPPPDHYPRGAEHRDLVHRHRALCGEIAAARRDLFRCREALAGLVVPGSLARAACRAITFAKACRAALDRLGTPRFVPPVLFPAVATAATFVGTDALSGATIVAAWAGLAMFGLCLAACVLACLFPADAVLDGGLRRARAVLGDRDDLRRRLREHDRSIAGLREQIRPLDTELENIRGSLEERCRALFAENWRALRGGDFEEYLARVFATLGYAVERTGQAGDHGVDLVAVRDGRRLAVQAKGYSGSVGNAAVRDAFTGRTIRKCDACAVITNSRFTAAAREAAAATGCVLVGEDEFEDFVLGRITFP